MKRAFKITIECDPRFNIHEVTIALENLIARGINYYNIPDTIIKEVILVERAPISKKKKCL